MNLTSLKIIKLLFQQYQVHPQKRLGQNFLIDKRVLQRILEAADLSSQDTVVEIGPGIGTLTLELTQRAKNVIAIEKDEKMAEILKQTLGTTKNVQIIQGDFLNLVKESLTKLSNYKVVANLPYYITSPVIRKFLEAEHKPKLMVLMVQKEVAQRICTKPPDMNLLAVSVQFYGEPKIVSYVSKNSFWPVPEVDSAIIKITQIAADINADARRFFKIVKAGFKQPRKQLLNNLSKGLGVKREKIAQLLKKNKLNPTQRAESLSLQDWINLTKSAIIEV